MKEAKFCIGQIVQHQMFDYRGVIIDVDYKFLGTEQWYEQVARSRPPKDQPWYHVLVGDAILQTYVAERNLEGCEECISINHPLLDQYFTGVEGGRYQLKVRQN